MSYEESRHTKQRLLLCFLPQYADAICMCGRAVNGIGGLTAVREVAW
jgi:hypothetical protein